MRHGAVFFDAALDLRLSRRRNGKSGVEAREGWASIDGEPPFRINKIADLPSDVVWLPNLDLGNYLHNGLQRSPNFVPDYYLRSHVGMIAAEIGAHQEHERVNVIVQAISEIFARTMRLAKKHFGVDEIAAENGRKKLEYSIAAAIGRRTQKIDASLNEALRMAYQSRTHVVGQSIPHEWYQCTLRRNRYKHAYEVLHSVGIPSTNNWEFVDGAKLPADRKSRMEWVLSNEFPVLAHATVADGKGIEAILTSYGGKAKSGLPREWLCAHELNWVSRYYSSIDIHAAYVCNDGYVDAPELRYFPPPTPFSLTSISLGLLVDNFFAALAEPYTSPSEAVLFHPHCVWLTAMERFYMFVSACRIVRASSYGNPHAGFRVHSYGQGNIQIAAPHEMVDELSDLAASADLEVPASAYWKRTMQQRMAQSEGMAS